MSAQKYDIRELNGQDAQAMAEIHSQSFERSWSALDMAIHIKRDICLGTQIPLAAFIIIRASQYDAEILTLATALSARRNGYGQALITAALKILKNRNIPTLFLEVAEDNMAARALYSTCGFSPIGRRPAYYRRDNGRMAAITFSKALDAVR